MKDHQPMIDHTGKLILGVHTGIPNELYHADRKAASSTWLKVIDKLTPFHLRSYLDSPHADPSPALIMGSAVDCLIFEPTLWSKQFIVAPEINRRTNAGKEQWAGLVARAKHGGKQIISSSDHAEALVTAQAIRMNPVMADVLKRGVAQQVVIWRDPITDLFCKCRTDWYDEETATIYDLKTARCAAPDEFAKAIQNFGYHIQASFYMDGYIAAGLPVERFVFGVMEKPDNRYTFRADPKLMAWYELTKEDEEEGRNSYTSALSAINFCMMNGEWAGYTDFIMPIERPGWARKSNVERVATL
jgi:exodeoxyribonuclease VIII